MALAPIKVFVCVAAINREQGIPGLDKNMTRAQFAKNIFKLKELNEANGASVCNDGD